jgi:hypothetical protein
MDSSPASSQAAASTAQSNESPSPLVTPTHAQAVASGFSLPHLELAAAILETVNMISHVADETKRVVHIPKAREHLTAGFEMSLSMCGNIFGMLGVQHNYDLDAFYDAANKFRSEQKAIAQRTEIARLAGMTLEEFDAKAKEIESKANERPQTSPTPPRGQGPTA